MKIQSILQEDVSIKKAGIIPFITTENGIEMMFMVSSDPAYGGADPMIAKGHIDQGEDVLQAAVREGEEELGLRQSNMKSAPFVVKDETIRGMTSTYLMRIYAVEVKSKTDFDTPHYETERVEWMTLDEYRQSGRRSQLGFVEALIAKISHA